MTTNMVYNACTNGQIYEQKNSTARQADSQVKSEGPEIMTYNISSIQTVMNGCPVRLDSDNDKQTLARRLVLSLGAQIGPKMGQIAPKCTEIWSEKVPDLSHLGPIWPISAKMYWNLIWKSPGLVPFGAKLTHFGPNLVPQFWVDSLDNWYIQQQWAKFAAIITNKRHSFVTQAISTQCTWHLTFDTREGKVSWPLGTRRSKTIHRQVRWAKKGRVTSLLLLPSVLIKTVFQTVAVWLFKYCR